MKQQSDGVRDPTLTPNAFCPVLSELEDVLDDSHDISSLTRSQVIKTFQILYILLYYFVRLFCFS